MYFISQFGKRDCLFTCMAIMLANYHHDKNYLFLPHEDKFYNYHDVAEEAKKYHMNLSGVKIHSTSELQKCNKFPIICTLVFKGNIHHSVVVTKVNRKNVFYYDPYRGKMKESLTSFSEKWNRSAMIVNDFEKTKCPIIPPKFIAKKDRITLPILQIISGASLLIGTYFVDKTYPIYVSVGLFAAFVSFEMLFRQNLINAMRRLDDNISSYSLKCESSQYFSFYHDIEKYRANVLTSRSSQIYSALIISFLIFVMIINSKYNLIYVAMSMIIAIVEVGFYQPYFKRKSEEIAEQEKMISEARNEYEFQRFSKETREKAYSVGLSKSIFTYLYIGMMLFTIILVMAFTENVSITYVVFYLCICVFMKEEATKMLRFIVENDNLDSLKNKVMQNLKIE